MLFKHAYQFGVKSNFKLVYNLPKILHNTYNIVLSIYLKKFKTGKKKWLQQTNRIFKGFSANTEKRKQSLLLTSEKVINKEIKKVNLTLSQIIKTCHFLCNPAWRQSFFSQFGIKSILFILWFLPFLFFLFGQSFYPFLIFFFFFFGSSLILTNKRDTDNILPYITLTTETVWA